MTNFKGSGGPPPSASNGGGSRFKKSELALYETVNGAQKKVNLFFLPNGAEVSVTTLDSGEMFDTSVRLHTRFKANGTFSNNAVCISQLDSRGCPLCDVLGEQGKGKWFACGTLLDGSKWEIPDGKRKGEVITNQRRLLLINPRQLDTFKKLGSKVKGWRGKTFDVSRGTDQKSARIGDMWIPTGALTEDQMKEQFAKAATAYGLPVEQYIQPLPYDKVLTPFSYEKLLQLANAIKATGGGLPVVSGTGTAEEDEIPF